QRRRRFCKEPGAARPPVARGHGRDAGGGSSLRDRRPRLRRDRRLDRSHAGVRPVSRRWRRRSREGRPRRQARVLRSRRDGGGVAERPLSARGQRPLRDLTKLTGIHFLLVAALVLDGVVLLEFLANLATVRRLSRVALRPESLPRVSIVIPARNEERSIEAA